MISLLVASGFLVPALASTTNGGPPQPDGVVPVTVPGFAIATPEYTTACPGGLTGCTVSPNTSWSDDIYQVTGSGVITITVTDCCFVADYYSLWMTTDPTGLTGWTLVGTTPQVHTDSNLVAPGFNPLWDGTGTNNSAGSFTVSVSGTALFAVRDELFDPLVAALASSCGGSANLLSNGCDEPGIFISPGFSPAGVVLTFSPVTESSVPEFGAPSMVMAAAGLLGVALLARKLRPSLLAP
jgi:hypothetical protein